MLDKLSNYDDLNFEDIKHVDEYGNEYWLARELQEALEYKKWQKFMNVIENAKLACEQSNLVVDEHFTQVGKMIEIAKGAKRKIEDYNLSRYACYLIVQSANPQFETVASGQIYFVVQLRKLV